MTFLSTVFLFALPAAALPVIVHLLARRRRKVIPWGAMQFLAYAQPRSKRSWRLRDLLLLLLRILVLAFFILAIARPLIPANWLGGHHTRDLVVVIDQSMSTGWEFATESAYERQTAVLREVFSTCDGNDYGRVLMASEKPEWVVGFPVKLDASSQKSLVAEVIRRKPAEGGATLLAGIEEAWAAPPAHLDATREVVVITDGQAHGWSPEQSGRWLALAHKAAEAPKGSVTRARLIPVSEDEPRDNLAVIGLTPSRGLVAAGEPVSLTATVKNFGRKASPTGILRWQSGDDAQELSLATVPALDAGAATTLKFEHAWTEPGVHPLHAVLDSADGLAADNRATILIEVASKLPVLVVEQTAPLAADESSAGRYLRAALGTVTGADQEGEPVVFQADHVAAADMDRLRLADYHAIILADPGAIPEDSRQELIDAVRLGTGLWIAAGPQTDSEAFNAFFVDASDGLSPLALADATGNPNQREDFSFISPPTRHHPATELLADTERLDLDEARIYRYFSFARPHPQELSILLRLDSGLPLAAEHAYGQGRVIVQSIPLGTEWSNLPLLQSYVALVYEWLWHLMEPRLTKRNLTPGQVFQWMPDRALKADEAVLLRPNQTESTLVIDARGPDRVVRVTDTALPGGYQVKLSHAGEATATTPFHVTRSSSESDLTPLTEETKTALRGEGRVVFGDGPPPEETEQVEVSTRQEPIWFWLLLGVIAFLVAESFLAWHIAKSRQVTTAGARMNPIST